MISRLELVNFRNHEDTVLQLTGGTTALIGDNGQGKTSVVEAMSYLSTLRSFRGVANDALIREGTDAAYVRATVVHSDGREILVECEINRAGRNRVLVNRQRLGRARDLLGVVRSTVFAPTDLSLVYEGPSVRRELVDDALGSLSRANDMLCAEVERIVRQRNMLLKQANGRMTAEISTTLDVWDEKLSESGTALGNARADLVRRLSPWVNEAYNALARRTSIVHMVYAPEWMDTGLDRALAAARTEDVRRAITSTGPHRDDIALSLNGMTARSHASQGETRTLALAIRLGLHRLITEETGEAPLLVLDDVLSELDPTRATALLESLPEGQVLITSAGPLPPAASSERVLVVAGGKVREEGVDNG